MRSWRRVVPEVDDERGMSRLRRVATVVLFAGLVACAGEAGSAPADPVLLDPGATATQGASTIPGAATPGTVDVDGSEPDHVEPPDPASVPVTAVPAAGTTRVALLGFGEVQLEVTTVDGEVLRWCLLLAETPAQRQRGLMEVLDPTLGGYDGMLFRFDEPHDGGFYMRNTPMPLSIAYLGADGGVVSIQQMEPCPDIDGCESYPSNGLFQSTIEAPLEPGGVGRLGIEPGAVVTDGRRNCA